MHDQVQTGDRRQIQRQRQRQRKKVVCEAGDFKGETTLREL